MIGIELVVRFLASHPYSVATCETYRRILVEFLTLDNLIDLDAAGLVQFVQGHTKWGNSQQWVALCACRKFLAWQFGASHPALSARIKRVRSRRQRTLTVASAGDLLASFDTTSPKGCRDLALCALGLDTGLRCSEFCRLKLVDVDLSAHNLQVIVKGGQWGTGVYSVQTAQYLAAWLVVRTAKPGVGEFFTNTRTGTALTRCGLNTVVKKWGIRLGIKLCPHDLRRSFATLSTIYGAPSRIVQKAGRWSNIDMVEHYTQDLDPEAIAPYLPVSRLEK